MSKQLLIEGDLSTRKIDNDGDESYVPLSADLDKFENQDLQNFRSNQPVVIRRDGDLNSAASGPTTHGNQQLLAYEERDFISKNSKHQTNRGGNKTQIAPNSFADSSTDRNGGVGKQRQQDLQARPPIIEAAMSLNRVQSKSRKIEISQANQGQPSSGLKLSFDPYQNKSINTTEEFFQDLRQAPDFYSQTGFMKHNTSSAEIKLFGKESWFLIDNKLFNMELKDKSRYKVDRGSHYYMNESIRCKIDIEPSDAENQSDLSKKLKAQNFRKKMENLKIFSDKKYSEDMQRQMKSNAENQQANGQAQFFEFDISKSTVTEASYYKSLAVLSAEELFEQNMEDQINNKHSFELVMRMYHLPNIDHIKTIDLQFDGYRPGMQLIVHDENCFYIIHPFRVYIFTKLDGEETYFQQILQLVNTDVEDLQGFTYACYNESNQTNMIFTSQCRIDVDLSGRFTIHKHMFQDIHYMILQFKKADGNLLVCEAQPEDMHTSHSKKCLLIFHPEAQAFNKDVYITDYILPQFQRTIMNGLVFFKKNTYDQIDEEIEDPNETEDKQDDDQDDNINKKSLKQQKTSASLKNLNQQKGKYTRGSTNDEVALIEDLDEDGHNPKTSFMYMEFPNYQKETLLKFDNPIFKETLYQTSRIKLITDKPGQIVIQYERKEKIKYFHQIYVLDLKNPNHPTTIFKVQEFPQSQVPILINNRNFVLMIDEIKFDKLQNLYFDEPIPVPLQLDFNIEYAGIDYQDRQLSADSEIFVYANPKTLADHLNLPQKHKQGLICSSLRRDSYNYCEKYLEDGLSQVRQYSGLKINQQYIWDFTVENGNTLVIKKYDTNKYQGPLQKPPSVHLAETKLQFDNVQYINLLKISEDNGLAFVVDEFKVGRLYKLQHFRGINDTPQMFQGFVQGEIYQIISLSASRLIVVKQITKQYEWNNKQAERKQFVVEAYQIDNRSLKLITTKQLSHLNPHSEYFQQKIDRVLASIAKIGAGNHYQMDKKSDLNIKTMTISQESEIYKIMHSSQVYNQFILIQQAQMIMVFDTETLEYLGVYEFKLEILNLRLINFNAYIQSTYNQQNLHLFEGLFWALTRLNPSRMHVRVDLQNNLLEYLNSDLQVISYINTNNIIQAINHNYNLQQKLTLTQQQEYLNHLEVDQLCCYMGTDQTKFDGTLLHQLIGKNYQVLETIQRRLLVLNPEMYPILFTRNINYCTPIDYSQSENDYLQIMVLLELTVKFQNDTQFNYSIDPHLLYLIEKGINIKEYLESQLPMQKIESKTYPIYSQDESRILHADFDQDYPINVIWAKHDEIFGGLLKENQQKASVQVEYFLINIPETITKQDFIFKLAQQNDLELFESELIKNVLDFKWKRYAQKFFIWQFIYFLVFLAAYLFDLYFFVLQVNDRSIVALILGKIIAMTYLLYTLYFEIKQMQKLKLDYTQEMWNLFDLLIIILYTIIIGIDCSGESPIALVIMHGAMLILIFIKLCQNLRIFKGFSFQVSMLQAVFKDIKYFILLYSFVIIMYGLIFTLLNIKPDDENVHYQGISYFGFFIMAFRASTGDFQVDNFYQLQEEHIIYAWVIWISAILFLNIILLNFIIAVISESYDKVMQKMVAESYKIKAQLISEHELHFNEEDFKDLKRFPRYLIVRRPVLSASEDQQDWQGFVKDIKKAVWKATNFNQNKTNNELISLQDTQRSILNKLNTLQSDMTQINQADTKSQNDSIINLLESIKEKLDSKKEEANEEED
eukprot:403370332